LQSAPAAPTLPYMYFRKITLPSSPGFRSWLSASLHRSMNSRSVSQSLRSCGRLLSSGMWLTLLFAASGGCRRIEHGQDVAPLGETRRAGLTAVGGWKHLRGLGGGVLGGLLGGQFWPDFLPVFWAQVAAGDGAVSGGLDGCAVLGRHHAAPAAPVAHGTLHYADGGGKFAHTAYDQNCFVELIHARSINTFVFFLKHPSVLFF
jgi:hypothetical protein